MVRMVFCIIFNTNFFILSYFSFYLMQRMLHIVGVPSSLHRGTMSKWYCIFLKFEDLIRVISEAISLGLCLSPFLPNLILFIILEK
ncbi:hypothetical protein GDO78_009479 [Eleutherodactylus coqui]|uniref:Uncharacterized protein n=1 Tax=Eleutherodactylus coqui TaxID=57060 RepID=A0A8J6F9L7_ELECQ|nr:hypothetical protein GDO78_009479 [Eleutherodactylus coqui]